MRTVHLVPAGRADAPRAAPAPTAPVETARPVRPAGLRQSFCLVLSALLGAVAVGASAAMWFLAELLHGAPPLNALMWFAAIVPTYVSKDIIPIMIGFAVITAVLVFLRSVRSRKV